MNNPAQRFFAVVVGVGEYVSSELGRIEATATDARALKAILTDPAYCGYLPENTPLLTGESASLGEFRAQLAWLAAVTDDSATALIYFSGHGGRPSEVASNQRYLFLRHTDLKRVPETALSTDDFVGALRRIRAGRLVVILDACYAAGAAAPKGAPSVASPWVGGIAVETIDGLSRGKGRVVIASSTALQPSFVRNEGDMSLFTHYLLNALRGAAGVRRDGYIHILDVFHYVSEAVRAKRPEQTPILKADDLDSNFPIAFDHGRSSPEEAASRTAARPLDAIREAIISSPEAGALALSGYLATSAGDARLRNEIDLIRERLQASHRETGVVSDKHVRAERSRLTYLLLERCLRIERGIYSSDTPDEIDAVATPYDHPGAPAEPRAPSIQVTIAPSGDANNVIIGHTVTNTTYNYSRAPDQVPKRPPQAQQGQTPKEG